MNRQQQILAGVLVLQLVLVGVAFWPRQTATGSAAPLFPDLESEDIVMLAVTDPDGNSVELRKEAGAWVLPQADGFPADEEKVSPVLDQISSLTSSRLVTRTSASHQRLQVAADDFVRRIDIETTDGTQHSVFLGSSPQYSATHFRIEGQEETYLTGDFSTWQTRAEAAAWIDTAYVQVDEEAVERITLENANGSFVFTRGQDADWTMEGLRGDETLDQAKVGSAVSRASSITMERPLGKEEKPEYGIDQPSAVVELKTDEAEITVRVGAQNPEDDSYVVKSSESPYYVQVAGYAVQDLVDKTRDDFLELPPTPTPEAETEAPN
jgi:hypothetical protein